MHAPSQSTEESLPVKCLLVTMFEPEGHTPGEMHFFQKAENLQSTVKHPGITEILTNPDGLVGLIVGAGTAKAAASMMSFGLDTRYDLRKTYIIIVGIAGGNPRYCSLGSAVWVNYVVDGDLAHEIDAREMPDDWSTGVFPLGSRSPFNKGDREKDKLFTDDEVYKLNSSLSQWAYNLTKKIDISDLDNPYLKKYNEAYSNFDEARKPPSILQGDNLSSSRYWHGEHYHRWAEQWVDFWTAGKAKFVTSSMEDSGTLCSLRQLAQMGKIDWSRVMLLRSISNYVVQPPFGMTPLESLSGGTNKSELSYPGYIPSLKALQRVGSRVIHEISDNWHKFKDTVPKGMKPRKTK